MRRLMVNYKISVIALLAVNLFPVFGIFVWEWDAAAIMVLYWAENVVIGFFNYFKMQKAQGTTSKSPMKFSVNKQSPKKVTRKFLSSFFLFHYGIFTGVHGIFVIVLFGFEIESFGWVLLSVLLLFISHGVSYFTNFILGGEYQRISYQDLFIQPYPRIIAMHIAVIAGGFLVMSLDSPPVALAILVVIKISIDLFLHLKERKKFNDIGK